MKVNLTGLLYWGLDVIREIQTIKTPVLTEVIKAITLLGSALPVVLLIPFLYLCVDEKKALDLGCLSMTSFWLNSAVKELCRQPRPFNLDPALGLAFEPSYGFPSGHAQLSLVIWILAASWGKKSPAALRYGAAAAFSLLIGYTRLYLGLHFPTDLLGGWLLGGLSLAIFFGLQNLVKSLLDAGGLRLKLIAAALAALVLNRYSPGGIGLGGSILGLCGGAALNTKFLGFRASSGLPENKSRRTLLLTARFLAGLGGMALLYLGLYQVLPGKHSADSYYTLSRFVIFTVLCLWISLGAPWLFTRRTKSAGGVPPGH